MTSPADNARTAILAIDRALLAASQNNLNVRRIINRQLHRLPEPTLLEKFGNDASLRIFQNDIPPAEALAALPPMQKVCLLEQLEGISRAVAVLGLPEELAAPAQAVSEELRSIVGGVVTVDSLANLSVLRMFLYADLRRNPGKLNQKDLHTVLTHIEGILFRFENGIGDATQIQDNLKSILLIFSANATVAPQGTQPRLLRILNLFAKVIKTPLLHLPLLLDIVRGPSDVLDGERFLDSKIEAWLRDFLDGMREQTEFFFREFKTHKPLQALEEPFRKLHDQSAPLIKGLISSYKRLQAYQQMTPTKRWQHQGELVVVEKTCGELKVKIDEWQGECQEHWLQIFQFAQRSREGNKMVAWIHNLLHHPLDHFSNLFRYALASIVVTCHDENTFNLEIVALLEPTYQKMGYVTLVDLLQLQIRSGYNRLQPQERTESLEAFFIELDGVLQAMRSYYSSGKYLKKYRRLDWQEKTIILSRAVVLQSASDERMPPVENSEHGDFFSLMIKMKNFLVKFLYTERWPSLFLGSPFADPVYTKENEDRFYFEVFLAIYRNFFQNTVSLEFFQEMINSSTAVSLPVKVAEARSRNGHLFLRSYQNLAKNKLEPSIESYREQALAFFDTLEELLDQLITTLDEVDIDIYALDLSSSEMMKEFGFFFPLVYLARSTSIGQPLIGYLNAQEMKAEEQKQKELNRKPPAAQEEETAVPPAAAVTDSPQPASKLEPIASKETATVPSLKELEKVCQQLAYLRKNFSAPNALTQMYDQHQVEHFKNISEMLPSLRELETCHDFDHPAAIAAASLKVAVLLEQAAKLVVAAKQLAVPKIVDDQNGGTKSLWEEHEPLRFAKLLEQAGFSLDDGDVKLLQKMKRVIAISYRYPASSGDFLLNDLKAAVSARGLFDDGLRLAAKILRPTLSPEQPTVEISPSYVIEKLLSLTTAEEKGISPVIGSFIKRIQAIQRVRTSASQRQVPLLHENDNSRSARIRIMTRGLSDLKINLQILSDLLAIKDRSFCLNQAEGILLRQAVILEKLLQILLAYLPVQAHSDSNLHYLLEKTGHRLRRDRHDLLALVDKLAFALAEAKIKIDVSLFLELKSLAQFLTPMIKLLYRYSDEAKTPIGEIQTRFKELSHLRSRVVSGDTLMPEEAQTLDRNLGISQPDERLPKLNRFIAQAVEGSLIQPTDKFLKAAEQLLTIAEKLLK